MQPSEARFFLRFESGDRAGEVLPLEPGVMTLGRRPGNHIVLGHSSVSGRHAELRVDARGIELVDLGSTNGTRVGATRIDRVRLAHGDRMSIGQVELCLEDRTIATPSDPVVRGAGTAPPREASRASSSAGESVGSISADAVAKAGKGGGLLAILLPVLLLAALGGGGWWWFTQGKAKAGGAGPAPVLDVSGNLFDYGSFEALEAGIWETTPQSTASLELDLAYAATGEVGMGATLEDDQWFVCASDPFDVRTKSGYDLSAACSVDGGRARLGVELVADDGGTPITIWGSSFSGVEFADAKLAFEGVSGFNEARILFAASGPSVVAIDDVVVLDGEGPDGASFGEFTAESFGGSTSVAVFRAGQPFLPRIQLDPWTAERFEAKTLPKASGNLAVSANDTGFGIEIPSGASQLELLYTGDAQGRVATTAGGVYQSHVGNVEREEVSTVLIGFGADLVQLSFPVPTKVTGDRTAAGVLLRVAVAGLDSMDVRLGFDDLKNEARELARRATDADRDGRHGEAIELWDELLATYPYEKDLIQGAEASRGERIAEGLAQLEALRGEFERARFFQLAELYAQCASSARSTATTFAGSEVEVAARALVIEIETSAAAESLDVGSPARERLETVLDSPAAERAPRFSEHLRREGLDD